MNYPTHLIYYCPWMWAHNRASFYVHGRHSAEQAIADAKTLAAIDDSAFYFVMLSGQPKPIYSTEHEWPYKPESK